MRLIVSIVRPNVHDKDRRYWVVPHVPGAQVLYANTSEEARRMKEAILQENIRTYTMLGREVEFTTDDVDEAVEYFSEQLEMGKLLVMRDLLRKEITNARGAERTNWVPVYPQGVAA